MTTAELISAMTQRIVLGFNPLRVILFGSQARGNAGRQSDIDLLVVLLQVANKRQTTIEIRQTLADFPIGKDIIVTTKALKAVLVYLQIDFPRRHDLDEQRNLIKEISTGPQNDLERATAIARSMVTEYGHEQQARPALLRQRKARPLRRLRVWRRAA